MNKTTKRGSCANCGSDNINYHTSKLEGECIFYPYDCEDCGLNGEEWYSLEYIETKIRI